MAKKIYPVASHIFPRLWKFFIRKMTGLENIPKDRALILCPNHASFFDDLIPHTQIGIKINKYVHPYVNSRFYKSKLVKKFVDWGQCIPIYVKKDMKGKDYDNTERCKLATK